MGFAVPLVLTALLALPAIWWLLRLTPPKPEREVFPPLRILEKILKREETPARSPWWLTALRLLVATLIILAMAGPILDPDDGSISGDGPLAILMDNGWASAPDWEDRVSAAEKLIDQADEAGVAVALAFTVADGAESALPDRGEIARERLLASRPQPAIPDRSAAIAALQQGLQGEDTGARAGTLALMTDNLAYEADETLNALAGLSASHILWFDGEATPVALNKVENGASAMRIGALRADEALPARYAAVALDIQGREIATASLDFAAGDQAAEMEFSAPFELRNDFAAIRLRGEETAGSVRLLDDSFRRRRVALISGEAADLAQPLLSPLYYISRALEPFADVVTPRQTDLASAIPELLAADPAMMVLADIGTMPDDIAASLEKWVNEGGTLLRFAGPRLAAGDSDTLVPVRLRKGDRDLGGALSWSEPQSLAPFSRESPFAGLAAGDDITVSRQVLAEPSADLADNTWASLQDGTPLITGARDGAGSIVLVHTTADASWSNLPISGTFVDMLRRIVALSHSAPASSASDEAASGTSASEDEGEATDGAAQSQAQTVLSPYRLLDADGRLGTATGGAEPLVLAAGENPIASAGNPPGLYGSSDAFLALNLFSADNTLTPLAAPQFAGAVTQTRSLSAVGELNLKPFLIAAALALLIVDGLCVLWLNGGLRRFARRPSRQAGATVAIVLAAIFLIPVPGPLHAADPRPGDEAIIDAIEVTRLAYATTGNAEMDEISRQGLFGLSLYLRGRTSFEPGDPVGVDMEADELSLFPIIYWPMDAQNDLPSAAAISRADAYMKNGGTIVFDTRDAFQSSFGAGGGGENTDYLRAVLADLDIPPLEPVPPEHVLTKAFYLLEAFPGRYRDGEMWVEAAARGPAEQRSASVGDGVSSIVISSNDLAGAWASDELGQPIYPTMPADPMQRELAYRTGVNLVMYTLTGNYKADQVHVPALLERLGQ